MENLFLPELDFNQPPEFNMKTFGWWSLKHDTLQEYIVFEDIFNEHECNQIIKLGKSFKIDESKTGDGRPFSDIRKSLNSWIPPCDLTKWLYLKVQDAVTEANKHFEFELHSFEQLQFTQYSEKYNGNYGPHIDKSNTATTPNSHRKLSFSVQISDQEKYEGGELLVYGSKNPIVANKKKGSISFFPSYTLHEVTAVTKGTRYSLVGWCSGPKFK